MFNQRLVLDFLLILLLSLFMLLFLTSLLKWEHSITSTEPTSSHTLVSDSLIENRWSQSLFLGALVLFALPLCIFAYLSFGDGILNPLVNFFFFFITFLKSFQGIGWNDPKCYTNILPKFWKVLDRYQIHSYWFVFLLFFYFFFISFFFKRASFDSSSHYSNTSDDVVWEGVYKESRKWYKIMEDGFKSSYNYCCDCFGCNGYSLLYPVDVDCFWYFCCCCYLCSSSFVVLEDEEWHLGGKERTLHENRMCIHCVIWISRKCFW